MKTFLLLTLSAVVSTGSLLACTAATTETIPPVAASGGIPVQRTMKPFGSEEELARYFRELAEKQKRRERSVAKTLEGDSAGNAAPLAMAQNEEKAKDDESVTNVQHAGVDEGDRRRHAQRRSHAGTPADQLHTRPAIRASLI